MFKKIDPKKLDTNLFSLLADDWALLAAGDMDKFNSMTVSWGGTGILWRKPVTTVYVRQTRYTKEFIDNNEYYTLTFLKDGNKDALSLLGSKSGRDIDKMSAECGLTPVKLGNGVSYEEAKLVFVCKKDFKTVLKKEDFLDAKIYDECYADNNLHTMYIGEIVECYINE